MQRSRQHFAGHLQHGSLWPSFVAVISFLLLSLFLPSSTWAVSETSPLNLSAAEKEWLTKHPTIRLAFDGYWAPYSFLNEQGEYEGIAVDYVKLLTERIGIHVEVYPHGKWETLFTAAKKHEVDVVATMVKRPEREQWFSFSKPYLTLSNVFITRKDNTAITSKSDIAESTVALVKNYFYVNQILEEFPLITPHFVGDLHDALLAVSTGTADVAIASPAIADFIARKYGISNLKYPAIYDKDAAQECLAVRKDWPELRSIFDKALAAVTEQERQVIFNRWIPSIKLATERGKREAMISLSREEKQWVREHPVVRVAPDPHFHPVEFIDENGQYQGVTADYLRLIGSRTGLSFQTIPTQNFNDSVKKVRQGEADMLSLNVLNKKTAQEYLFSEMFLDYSTMLLVRKSEPSGTTINSMAGRKIAVPKGYPDAFFLSTNYPEIIQVAVPDIATGVRLVSSGKLDGITAYLPTASSVLEREHITNLRLAGDIGMDTRDGFAVRRDLPILQSILDKGLQSITEQERQTINRRWIFLEKEDHPPGVGITFTLKEKSWLAAHPVIRIGIMNAWPPMDYIDAKGQPQGIGVEFIKAFNKRLDNRLQIVPGPWNEIYKAVKEKKLDALMDITPSPAREAFFLFTDPYITVPHLIFTRADSPERSSLHDLSGMSVGVEKGFFIVQVLNENYPNIRVQEYTTTSDALDALSKGEVDAYVGNRAVARYIIEHELIGNIKAQGKISETSSRNAIGVRKDWPILHDILQKVLSDISPREFMQLIKPFPRMASKQQYSFTEKLSPKEQQWLKQQSDIHIGVMDAWPPMSYMDKNGAVQGIGIDYLEAINKRLGNILVPVPAPFKENYELVKNRKLGGIMDITPKPEREPFFAFTKPYLSIPHVFVARKDSPYIDSAEELNGRSVALEKGYYNVKFFQNEYPQVTVKEYPSTAEALGAVSRGEADAYAGNRLVAMYLIRQELLFNLVVQGRMQKPPVKLNVGVRKDWPILAQIIDKAIGDISPEEIRQIHTHWVGEFKKVEQDSSLNISKKERAWLDAHQTIRLGVGSGWPPVEWIDEAGQYQGVVSEYLKHILEMLTIETEPVEQMWWTEVLKKAENKEVDLLPAIVASPEREKFLRFTTPYLSFPYVIFTRENAPFITGLEDLYHKLVGVEEDFISHQNLQKDHPEIRLKPFKSTQEILQALSLGTIDAYVGNLTVANYLIKKSGYTNIKVAASAPYSFDLSIGVRKDWPELIPILEKGLAMIDEEQRNEIRQKWLTLHYDTGVDYQLVKKIVFSAAGIILFMLLWGILIYRKDKLLKEAKAETDQANAQLVQANTKLQEMDKMKSMFIASISHELRTPLNSIIGFSGMMMQGAYGELSEKYQDYIMRVNRSGQHLLALITDIIDISKIEAGRVDVLQNDFTLEEITAEADAALRQQIEDKGLSLKITTAESVALHTDKRRLYQCVLNLLSNAMKYSENGTITVNASEQGDNVILSVEDTGVGISEEDQHRLFEAFERMDSHLKVKAGGTGLGLYLTKKIVTELLQGEIGVKSTLNQGSRFWIKVPQRIDPQKIPALPEGINP